MYDTEEWLQFIKGGSKISKEHDEAISPISGHIVGGGSTS
jgi:hypothetical protein